MATIKDPENPRGDGMSAPFLQAAYKGRAADMPAIIARMRALKHAADHNAPIPAGEALWLVNLTTEVIAERGYLVASISSASSTLKAILPLGHATDCAERTMGL